MSDTNPAAVAATTDAVMNVLQSHDPSAAPADATSDANPTPPPPAVEEPKVDDKSASKFAALSRKEREIRNEQKRLKAQQDTISKQLQEFEAFKKEREEFENQFKTNPLEALKKRGLSYDKLTEEYVLKGDETPEQKTSQYLKQLEEKLAAFETKLTQKEEAEKKAQEDLKVRQAEEAKTNYVKQLKEFIETNSEKYELIARNDASQLVFDVIEAHYQQTAEDSDTGEGVILTRDEAADAVENYLLEDAKKLMQASKLKKLSEAPVAPDTTKPSSPKPTATLTNNPATVVPTTGSKFLSDDESKRQMAAMLKWNT